jgi:hypothetical protein
MKELFVYICAIFVVLYVIFVAMNAMNGSGAGLGFGYGNQTLKRIYEGLENASSSTTTTDATSSATPSASASSASSATMPVTGVGATSQLYAQTVATAISSLETELGMDAYSQQYINIIDNLKILYKQRALKAVLQTPTKNDNTANLIPLYLYGQNLQTLDMLQDFIDNKKKNSW